MSDEMKRLVRSRDDRMLGGVCGGVAEYFGVDPTLVRLLWVAAALLPGNLGVVGYLVALFLMPNAPEAADDELALLEESLDVEGWADQMAPARADEATLSDR